MAKKSRSPDHKTWKRHVNLSKVTKMSWRRQDNPSEKARKSRQYRKNQRQQRRFECPLRQFVEIKYKNIYDEYVELYKRMDAKNPGKIDLRKSKIFKEWKKANEQSISDILSLAIRETIKGNGSESEHEPEQDLTEHSDSEHESEHSEPEQADCSEPEQVESEHDNGDTNNDGVIIDVIDEGLLAARQVDELVNQMELDDQLRQLLDSEPDDEGIDLNIFDELAMDIEPFDYHLEVELGDW